MIVLKGILLASAALVASTIAAMAGTGGGVVLLPVMTAVFGVRHAVPMYAVAQLIGNGARIALNWRDVKWSVVGWFVLGAVPAAMIGSLVFAVSEEGLLTRLLGAFLLIIVLGRRLRAHRQEGFAARWFTPIGAVFGCVSAAVGSAGPFLAPFYLTYGLVRGAYIGTEATGTAVMHVTKLMTYQLTGVLSPLALVIGVSLGPLMLLGTWLGKRVVDRLPSRVFALMIDSIVIVFGIWFLIRG